MIEQTTDRSEAIEQLWPYDGPHDDESVVQAAEAVAALVRYLNNATGPGNGRSTVASVPTVRRILGPLSGSVFRLDQLLMQLAGRLDHMADDETLRHDDPGTDPAQSVQEASTTLMQATAPLTKLGKQLDAAHQSVFPIGHNWPEPEEDEL